MPRTELWAVSTNVAQAQARAIGQVSAPRGVGRQGRKAGTSGQPYGVSLNSSS